VPHLLLVHMTDSARVARVHRSPTVWVVCATCIYLRGKACQVKLSQLQLAAGGRGGTVQVQRTQRRDHRSCGCGCLVSWSPPCDTVCRHKDCGCVEGFEAVVFAVAVTAGSCADGLVPLKVGSCATADFHAHLYAWSMQ
jgi:hypothetical protein